MAVFSEIVSRLIGATPRERLARRIVLKCERDVWARMDRLTGVLDPAEARGFFHARALRVVRRALAADPQAAPCAQQLLRAVMDRLLADWIAQHAALPARIPVTRQAA